MIYEEEGIKFPEKTKKEFLDAIGTLKRIGTFQPADNEAYRSVKRFSVLRQLEKQGIDVDDIYERADFRSLTADEVMH